MSDSAQSSGLKARVGHLDISSALPDSLVQLVGDSLNSKLNSSHIRLFVFGQLFLGVYPWESPLRRDASAMTHFTLCLCVCVSV